MVKLTAVASFD